MSPREVSLPDDTRDLLAAAASLSNAAYVVGGSLRDALLVRPITDLDLALPGDAPGFARALADALGGHYALLDAERGTARIALDEGAVRVIDVAALRGDIVADLAQRDYTIDALAAPLTPLAAGEAVEPIDPHNGVADIEARTVRLVSEQALLDDPLRLLRAVRLAVQLGFEIAPDTLAALRRHARRLGEAAAERQRDEIARCFATDRAAQALRLMDGIGLLDQVIPEITAARGVEQPKEHHWDVFDHSLETVAALDFMLARTEPADARQAELWAALWRGLELVSDFRAHFDEELSDGRSRAALLKLAGLLHDVAKPETRAPDETGRIRFFGHAERGAEIAEGVLRRLRYSRRETQLVATMVEEHLRPTQLSNEGPPSRRALYRYFRDTGEAAESVLLLSLADALAARGPKMSVRQWQGHVAYIAHVLARRDEEESITRPQRLLSGTDVISELEIAPGPEIGRLLGAVEEAHASGEVADRDEALDFVRRLHDDAGRAQKVGGRS